MSRATEDALADLHGALARTYMDKLMSGEYTTADINSIRQFLKDNNISCIGEANDSLKNIVSILPAFDEADLGKAQEG